MNKSEHDILGSPKQGRGNRLRVTPCIAFPMGSCDLKEYIEMKAIKKFFIAFFEKAKINK